MSNPRRPDKNRDSTTFLALFALMAVAAGLLFLSALVMPQMVGVLAVVCGLFFFGAFHYVVWGWWLSGVLKKDDDDEA